jgi:hypothetical protein
MLSVRSSLRAGVGTGLVLLIMFIGSLGLWVGAPLAWLWIGAQIEGATDSLSTALGAMAIGVVATVAVLAALLAKLSNTYRANRQARGLEDPGHVVLEGVLVVSAGITLVAFGVWFFFFSGTNPIPLGLNV